MLGIFLLSLVGAMSIATLSTEDLESDATTTDAPQEDDASTATAGLGLGPLSEDAPEVTNAASETTQNPESSPETDTSQAPLVATAPLAEPAAAPSDGETINLIITSEMIAHLDTQHVDNPCAYTTHVDLTQPTDQFECDLPSGVSGQFFLVEYTQEEPTGDDESVEMSRHLELIYTRDGQEPSQAALMGVEPCDMHILAHIDLGHVLMDTDTRDFIDGHINESPALGTDLTNLNRINVYV